MIFEQHGQGQAEVFLNRSFVRAFLGDLKMIPVYGQPKGVEYAVRQKSSQLYMHDNHQYSSSKTGMC